MYEAKYTVNICCGSKCKRKGSKALLETMRERLGLSEEKAIREDKLVKLVITDCLQNCGDGPIITINGKEYVEVDEVNVEQICDRLLSGSF